MFFNIIVCMKKALLTPMLALLLLFGCKEDENNYYYPYQISASVEASKPSFIFNNITSKTKRLEYMFNDASSGDIVVLNLKNNPVTLLDSVLVVNEDVRFDTIDKKYDTIYTAQLVYIYDTTFFRVDFKVGGKIVQIDSGYSTGYNVWRSGYIVK